MRSSVYHFIRKIVQVFLKRPEIYGINNIDRAKPAVFVANHLGSFGPVILNVYLPLKFIPWVTHEVTDKELCPEYLTKDFIQPEMKLQSRLGKLVAVIIGRLCVSVMEYIDAIPVYKKSKKLIITIEKSVKELEEGRHLLIFPEIHNAVIDETVNDFQTGFMNIARTVYKKDNMIVNFYPICVNRENNTIKIGKGTAFNPDNPFSIEKKRVVSYLQESIKSMYHLCNDINNDASQDAKIAAH